VSVKHSVSGLARAESPGFRASARDQRGLDTIEEFLPAVVQNPGGNPGIEPAQFRQLRVPFDIPVPLPWFGPMVLALEIDPYPVLGPAGAGVVIRILLARQISPLVSW
jgi:hypothetical protein